MLGELADAGIEDAGVLEEMCAAWRRVGSWARAQEAASAYELSRRPELNPVWPKVAGDVKRRCTAGDSLAM